MHSQYVNLFDSRTFLKLFYHLDSPSMAEPMNKNKSTDFAKNIFQAFKSMHTLLHRNNFKGL